MKLGMVVHAYNPTLRKWRQEDCEFEANLDSTVRPYSQKKKKKKDKTV
jgi:hypothetical protein